MPKEQVAPQPGIALPVEYVGKPPSFGQGIETKLYGTGRFAAGQELVLAHANVPVRMTVPVLKQMPDGSTVKIGDSERVFDKETVLPAGVAHTERRNGKTSTEERLIHDNGSTHVLVTEMRTPSHDVQVMKMFKGSLLLHMDREAMVRLHVVESQEIGSGAGGCGFRLVEGVMQTSSFLDPENPRYSYVQATVHADSGEITQFRIEHEEPFR